MSMYRIAAICRCENAVRDLGSEARILASRDGTRRGMPCPTNPVS